MAFEDEKDITVYYNVETAYGAMNTTPNWIYFDKTSGGSATMDVESLDSTLLNTNHDLAGITTGNKSASIDLPFPLKYGVYDRLFEGALQGAYQTDVPSAGTDSIVAAKARVSYSILIVHGNITTGKYDLYLGCEISQLDMSFPVSGDITGSFGFFAATKTSSDSAPAGSVFLAQTTGSVMVSNGGAIAENDVVAAYVTEVTMGVSSPTNPRWVWGTNTSARPSVDMRSVTFGLSCYLTDETTPLKVKHEAGTVSKLNWSVADAAGNVYGFILQAIKYTDAPGDMSGSSVPLSLQGKGFFDTASGTSMFITKTDV